MRAFLVIVAVLILPMAALSGCIGKGDGPPVKTNETKASTNATNFTLPDDRGVSAAANETNKTEAGTFGEQHTHDYWKGKEQIVIFQQDVGFSTVPLFPEGPGTNAEGSAYIKLDQPTLIYEGTNEVVVLIKGSVDPTLPATPDPAPPTVKLSYRTAADNKFHAAPAVTLGSPITLAVTPQQTDMPHSVSSLWAFQLLTDKPYFSSVNVTITIKRGAAIVDWPGHPDFYAEKTERVIVDKDFKVHRAGIEEGIAYGSASSWVAPDKLISYQTGLLDVFINITKATASNGATPTGFFLEYHNATILDAEDTFNERIDDKDKGRSFSHKDFHFVVKVDPAGMDGPYQPSSRWGFRPVATFAETPAASMCPGCFAYDIEYHLTIVAHKATDATALVN
ncbi:MAG: hypothetical protein WDA16_00650 [Candidatus Thermoplasmatota archaeon]